VKSEVVGSFDEMTKQEQVEDLKKRILEKRKELYELRNEQEGQRSDAILALRADDVEAARRHAGQGYALNFVAENVEAEVEHLWMEMKRIEGGMQCSESDAGESCEDLWDHFDDAEFWPSRDVITWNERLEMTAEDLKGWSELMAWLDPQ
jgi:hypothetical protein